MLKKIISVVVSTLFNNGKFELKRMHHLLNWHTLPVIISLDTNINKCINVRIDAFV